MGSYNLLILSVGRRVELVQCFGNAARRLGIDSLIVGGDCSDMAPALYFADRRRILPRISSPAYVDSIINACNQNDIRLIVPTIDTELLLLSRNREEIESQTNAKVLISDESVVEICSDKINTQKFLEANGFRVPHLYTEDELDQGDLTFPLFIKPKAGSSSIDAYKIHNEEELRAYRSIIESAIVQDFVEGEEFTIDAFLDFDCNVITIVPRYRIAVRSGEISKGRIARDREIIDDIKKLLMLLKPIGQITVQCIKTMEGIKYVEINPRFGGGAPMSISSGADSCENLYRLLMGEELRYSEDYQDHLTFLRFDSSICLDEKMELVKVEI